MHDIDIGIEKIDKIYHIADVHVRNVKRHKEYKLVFKRLYTYIKKTKTVKAIPKSTNTKAVSKED